GEVSDAEAIQRLSRSPPWVWAAIDPVTKVLLTIDVGDRPLAMAQRVVHQVVQVLAPGCVPLFLTDGFKEYTVVCLDLAGNSTAPQLGKMHPRQHRCSFLPWCFNERPCLHGPAGRGAPQCLHWLPGHEAGRSASLWMASPS